MIVAAELCMTCVGPYVKTSQSLAGVGNIIESGAHFVAAYLQSVRTKNFKSRDNLVAAEMSRGIIPFFGS